MFNKNDLKPDLIAFYNKLYKKMLLNIKLMIPLLKILVIFLQYNSFDENTFNKTYKNEEIIQYYNYLNYIKDKKINIKQAISYLLASVFGIIYSYNSIKNPITLDKESYSDKTTLFFNYNMNEIKQELENFNLKIKKCK